MSYIKADMSQMKMRAQEIDSFSKDVNRIVSRISSIRLGSGSSSVGSLQQIQRTLDDIHNHIQTANKNVAGLSKAFSDIAKEYQKTEAAIKNGPAKKIETSGDVKDVFSDLSTVSTFGSQFDKSGSAALTSSIFGLSSAYYTFTTNTDQKTSTDVKNYLNVMKKSGEVETKLYDFFMKDKKMSIYDTVKLDQKYGNTMSNIKVGTKTIGLITDGIDAYNVYTDKNKNKYDRQAANINILASFIDTGGGIYTTKLAKDKSLEVVGNSTVKGGRNQILSTPELKYKVSDEKQIKIDKVDTALNILGVVKDTTTAGLKRYGEVSADGEVTFNDELSVVIHGSTSGLTKVVSKATKGVINIDAEASAIRMEDNADTFYKRDNFMARYISDQSKPEVCRIGMSMVSGAYVVGEETVHLVVSGGKKLIDTAEKVDNAIVDATHVTVGWIKSLF